MDLRKALRRRSLNAAEDAQPSGRALSPAAAAAEKKAKRYTWAFNPAQALDHVTSEDSGEEQDSFAVPFPEISRSTSSASLQLLSLETLRDLGTQSRTRPRSAGSALDSGSSSIKAIAHQAGALPTIMEKKYIEISTGLQSRNAIPKVKRWDAKTRTASPWDGLRRDSELFSQRGNCSIHLYDKGQSRRGPSLKIPLDRIYAVRFASLFTLFRTELARTGLNDDYQTSGLHRQCDLYIPAPDETSRKDSFTWHITTRNFFAFVLGRPVVGVSLGQALIDLRERIDVFRPHDPRNHMDMMSYLDRLGYLDFAHCPEYAVSVLNFAEHCQIQDLWVDAFVHCVGMNDALRTTWDYQNVSRVTHALITRAYLEMDLHLGRVTRALSNFLEDDFSPAHFGVSIGARIHLDRFRTFLHEYYVGKLGYWPPPKRTRFSKSLYKSMYFDFRALYDYLVDLDSSDSLADQKPASGGICVLQNVKAFDDRHNYIPLPHPHPLLPIEAPAFHRSAAAQGSRMRSFVRGTKSDPAAERAWNRDALAAASNCMDPNITNAPLVKAYQRFERDYITKGEEKVSVWDARKVRWLLVYGTLQMLISVIRAPKEVRMTETSYPLCCLVTGTPPWEAGLKALISSHTPSVIPPSRGARHIDVTSAVSIQPDCETDDYISSKGSLTASSTAAQPLGRRLSTMSSQNDSSPTPPSRVGLLRNASLRSVRTLSSSIGSISSYRPSSRRRSIEPPPVPALQSAASSDAPYTTTTVSKPGSNFCEIVIHGYGNGLADTIPEAPSQPVPVELTTENLPEIVVSPQSPPSSPPWKETRSNGVGNVQLRASRTSERLQEVALRPSVADGGIPKSDVPEPSRTPLMDGFDRSLPGLDEFSDAPSTDSSSSVGSGTPLAPIWSSSRSNSPHSSTSSQTATDSTGADHKAAHEEFSPVSPISPTFTDSSFSMSIPLSPTSPIHILPGLPTLSTKKSMDLPMVVDVEEMRVYQPTGVPSVGNPNDTTLNDDDEEFPDREADKRWSVANKSRVPIVNMPIPLKSSLRRTRTAASNVTKRRSVRIKEEPTEWVSRFRNNVTTY